jgi:hypothetical protein
MAGPMLAMVMLGQRSGGCSNDGSGVVSSIGRLSKATKAVVVVVREFEVDGAAGVVERFALMSASPASFNLPVLADSIVGGVKIIMTRHDFDYLESDPNDRRPD